MDTDFICTWLFKISFNILKNVTALKVPDETKQPKKRGDKWWKISKRTQTDGEIYHVHGLEELVLSKWLYYPKQSIDSMQSLSSYQQYFSQN